MALKPADVKWGGGNTRFDLVWENPAATWGTTPIVFDNGIEYDYFIIQLDDLFYSVDYANNREYRQVCPITMGSNFRLDAYSRSVSISKSGTQITVTFSDATYYRVSSASNIGTAVTGNTSNGCLVPKKIYGVIKNT